MVGWMAMLSCRCLQLPATKLALLIARPHSSRVKLIVTPRISDPKEILRGLRAATFSIIVLLLLAFHAFSQEKKKTGITSPAPLIKRSIAHEELVRLGYGGTVTILGAPEGSITIEGWTRTEVELRANIELQAETEDDLNRLAIINGVVVDRDLNHVRILTTGTHDKVFMKRAAKNFPKKLLGLPWKIDYSIKVPTATDLEINAGRGPISLTGVEGAINLSATESQTNLTLIGGDVIATVASGNVDVKILGRSWRGRGVNIRVATGDLQIQLPVGFNSDIDADVLRQGRIEDNYGALVEREQHGITARIVRAQTGGGGPPIKLLVGDGVIRITKEGTQE